MRVINKQGVQIRSPGGFSLGFFILNALKTTLSAGVGISLELIVTKQCIVHNQYDSFVAVSVAIFSASAFIFFLEYLCKVHLI